MDSVICRKKNANAQNESQNLPCLYQLKGSASSLATTETVAVTTTVVPKELTTAADGEVNGSG